MSRLRTLRDEKGLMRKYVAGKLGISGRHLNDIESGRVNLTEENAEKLSKVYGVKIGIIKSMHEEDRDGKI